MNRSRIVSIEILLSLLMVLSSCGQNVQEVDAARSPDGQQESGQRSGQLAVADVRRILKEPPSLPDKAIIAECASKRGLGGDNPTLQQVLARIPDHAPGSQDYIRNYGFGLTTLDSSLPGVGIGKKNQQNAPVGTDLGEDDERALLDENESSESSDMTVAQDCVALAAQVSVSREEFQVLTAAKKAREDGKLGSPQENAEYTPDLNSCLERKGFGPYQSFDDVKSEIVDRYVAARSAEIGASLTEEEFNTLSLEEQEQLVEERRAGAEESTGDVRTFELAVATAIFDCAGGRASVESQAEQAAVPVFEVYRSELNEIESDLAEAERLCDLALELNGVPKSRIPAGSICS